MNIFQSSLLSHIRTISRYFPIRSNFILKTNRLLSSQASTKMAELREVMSHKCYGGYQKVFAHLSKEVGCEMKFSIYLPSVLETQPDTKLPVVYFLSGLTCDEMTMIEKSNIQAHAEQYKLIVVGPDTSPRNCNVPGENDNPIIGVGAGFYIDAIQEPWKTNYRMQSYVSKELREVIARNFSCADNSRAAITGHSMGGHGALVTYLRNPSFYKAVSAFAPSTNPINLARGRVRFLAYMGPDESLWKGYDATELVRANPQKGVTIVVEQGSDDDRVSPDEHDNFVKVCKEVGQPLDFKVRSGYGHSYYYVKTFIGEHMKRFGDILHSC